MFQPDDHMPRKCCRGRAVEQEWGASSEHQRLSGWAGCSSSEACEWFVSKKTVLVVHFFFDHDKIVSITEDWLSRVDHVHLLCLSCGLFWCTAFSTEASVWHRSKCVDHFFFCFCVRHSFVFKTCSHLSNHPWDTWTASWVPTFVNEASVPCFQMEIGSNSTFLNPLYFFLAQPLEMKKKVYCRKGSFLLPIEDVVDKWNFCRQQAEKPQNASYEISTP